MPGVGEENQEMTMRQFLDMVEWKGKSDDFVNVVETCLLENGLTALEHLEHASPKSMLIGKACGQISSGSVGERCSCVCACSRR